MADAKISFPTLAENRSNSAVGDDIRALRKSRSVTLADLAQSLERSTGWLSQVERGQTEPGIPDLRRIAAIFEIPISFFFRNESADEPERGLIVRRASRASLGSRRDGLTEELLSPNLSGDFEMIRSVFEPHSKSGTVDARPTQEGGYLMKGQLVLTIGAKRFELEEGDSFQFQNEPYTWENPGSGLTIVIWVISPPIY